MIENSEAEDLDYLVIGAGGTGGPLAAYLAGADKQITLIARGETKERIARHGLVLESSRGTFAVPVSVCDGGEYQGAPHVVFVCVKGYSLEGVIPLLERVCTEGTIVIPLLNIYGTGTWMQERLPRPLVTDGCIYIAGEIKTPGTILLTGEIFRVVFGVRNEGESRPELEEIAGDLRQAGIDAILSVNIRRDTMQKFSYVSPMAACGLLHDVRAGEMQRPGRIREDFTALIREVEAVAHAMGMTFPVDLAENNLAILDKLQPQASTSLKRDVDGKRPSELDGLIIQVVRMGRQYGVPTPLYRKVARKFGFSEEG